MLTLDDYNERAVIWNNKMREDIMKVLINVKPYPNVKAKDAEKLIDDLFMKLDKLNRGE